METELLKPEELDTHVLNKTLRLAFIGMSNAGKSYRSKILRDETDFLWFHVDEGIYRELGFASIEEISSWLGYPTSERYEAREAKYLELENKLTRQSSMRTDGKNLVFDTTGSVVHLSGDTLKTLHDNCLVVHLDVGEESLEKFVERFFKYPKPVAWCGFLQSMGGGSFEEAVRRSYPKLLQFRLKRYRALAQVNVPAREVRDTSARETLNIIKKYLST
ncbi:hypothetical protein CL652_00165 [bacterium]|nr:hypothetical protein [bacterium]|tara:strand:- start:1585 stop:2241 length:657 start_codon:yes stop_codon:yes gene_type:complete